MGKAVRFLRIACVGTVLAIGIVAFSNTAQASKKTPGLIDIVVCVDNATSVLKASVDRRCDRSSEFKVVWKARGSSPRICVNLINREMSIAQAEKCFQKNTRLARPATGNKIIACASSSTRVLRWPITGKCLTTNTPVRWFVADTTTTPTTSTSVAAPNQPIITTSTSTTSLPPMLITTPVTSTTSTTSTTVAVDMSAPTLTSTTPSDDATGISDSTTVVLNFSERVWGVVGKNIYVKRSSDSSIFETIPADGVDPTSNGTYGNGTTQITVRLSLTPTFSYNTEYYVQIDSGAFEDSAGNGFTGISSMNSLNFTIYNPTCAQKLAWGVDCLVGDTGPGGGVVFYTSGTGSTKYMEVGPTTWYDNTARQNFTWCAGKETQAIPAPGTGTALGTGSSNTARIASFCNPNGGAHWITQKNASGGIGGQTDWFLPSKDELNYLCLYARQLPENAGTCTNSNPLRAGFLNQSYWSSSEFNWRYAWYQNFINGGQAYFDGAKELSLYVRPVRAFG